MLHVPVLEELPPVAVSQVSQVSPSDEEDICSLLRSYSKTHRFLNSFQLPQRVRCVSLFFHSIPSPDALFRSLFPFDPCVFLPTDHLLLVEVPAYNLCHFQGFYRVQSEQSKGSLVNNWKTLPTSFSSCSEINDGRAEDPMELAVSSTGRLI